MCHRPARMGVYELGRSVGCGILTMRGICRRGRISGELGAILQQQQAGFVVSVSTAAAVWPASIHEVILLFLAAANFTISEFCVVNNIVTELGLGPYFVLPDSHIEQSNQIYVI